MIITEKPVDSEKFVKHEFSPINFGDAMSDGRLTEYSSTPPLRLREAILMVKRLGRPLTDEEMKAFIRN